MNFARLLNAPIAFFTGSRRVAKPASRRRPAIGATLCCNQFRFTVQAGFNRDLWLWLQAQGWRELQPGETRYRFRALPSDVGAALIDCAAEARERLLALGMRRALGEAPVRDEKIAA